MGVNSPSSATKLSFIAPAFAPHDLSEVAVFGAAVWLWTHSEMHQNAPLKALHAALIPAIKTGQYLLAFENDQPVAYVAWAQFDEKHEALYLHNPSLLHKAQHWQSGNRLWFTDCITPFGHARAVKHHLMHRLFASGLFRSLYHKGKTKGMRIVEWHGIAVYPREARHWFDEHPVMPANGTTKTTHQNTHEQGTTA